ncbi:MAG: hypothetical protein A2Z20_00845 [Bdellovibrionales bacterium RBG_16_40_8]|nr:MAG: hypothetical protein A2Z20_00845 [Bdellovibrionales bacterium RBG_16_40_8]
MLCAITEDNIMNSISDSKFNVWRVLVLLIYTDGCAHEKEKEWLSQCISRFELTNQQKEQLRNDFKSQQDFRLLLPSITDIKDFSHLIHMTNILFHVDDKLSNAEQVILKDLNSYFDQVFSTNSRRELARSIVSSYNNSWQIRVPEVADYLSADPRWQGRWQGSGRGAGLAWCVSFLFRRPWILIPILFAYCSWLKRASDESYKSIQTNIEQRQKMQKSSQDNSSKSIDEWE